MATERVSISLVQLGLLLAALEQRVGLTNDSVLELRRELTELFDKTTEDNHAENGRTGSKRRRE